MGGTGTGGTGNSGSGGTGTGGTGSPPGFAPNLFSIDNSKYKLGDAWPDTIPSPPTTNLEIDGYGKSTNGWASKGVATDARIVDAPYMPLTGKKGTFTTPPSSGKALEFGGKACVCSGGADQAIRLHVSPSTFPVTNLEGKVTMTQTRTYDPLGYDYGTYDFETTRKMHRWTVNIGGGIGDWALRTEGAGVNGGNGQLRLHQFGSGKPDFILPKAPLLYPSGPAATTLFPADRWNTFHVEITWSIDPKVGRIRVWYNQQQLFDQHLQTMMKPGIELVNLKYVDPWNSGQTQTQYQYHDDWIMTVYDGGAGDWPFGKVPGAPDIVTNAPAP